MKRDMVRWWGEEKRVSSNRDTYHSNYSIRFAVRIFANAVVYKNKCNKHPVRHSALLGRTRRSNLTRWKSYHNKRGGERIASPRCFGTFGRRLLVIEPVVPNGMYVFKGELLFSPRRNVSQHFSSAAAAGVTQ